MLDVIKEFIYPEASVTKACHASTVLPLPNGDVAAAWFGGTKEGDDDVRIWFSLRSGGRWSEPTKVLLEENLPHWNPVLDLKPDGTICLYYKVGQKIQSWQTKYVLSSDFGKTWTNPLELVLKDKSGGRGPVKNKCIRASNGTLLAPSSTEQGNNWRCFIDASHDEGKTWQKQKTIPRPKKNLLPVAMIQPTIWESEPGIIHALLRTNAGKIYKSDSKNYGASWCKAYETDLANNNSGIDCVKDENSNIWLVYNPVSKNWGGRSPLSLALSKDNGNSWQDVYTLENQPGGEFSYPAITAAGNILHITYTYNRKTVAYVQIKLA